MTLRSNYTTLAICLGISSMTNTLAFAPSSTSTSTPTSRNIQLDMAKKVFIDGEAGTTGLQVRERLSGRDDIEIISPPYDLRKDEDTRKKMINEADAVILCLPDEASIEAASWVEPDNDRTVLIDASTAFRVNEDWDYGFPELSAQQRSSLEKSKRIANPGCYPTGFIGLTAPLVEAGILPAGTPITVNAISGYSGGGKALMNLFESDEEEHEPWSSYAFGLAHKHIPEMAKYSGLGTAPIFQPAIADFDQGMVVSVPLHYTWLKEGTTGKDIHDTLEKHYKGSKFISVMPGGESNVKEAGLLTRGAFLRPDTLKNTNKMELFVFYNDDAQQALLCARLDNLGKGASGAAVQNLNIALGVEETTGL
mmetsp:Transcript_12470/g.15803  ORF Transcript_12470/g.15803 Transcript_12470/m.15803 type:complete len:366 (-) Transcript_12470:763-1860(-)|eukprot:CAMPEP_0203638062 /NCGR_PEP_ID=MMETSP0088-20131115/4198_1 /ASSEMBLY_ACC=CAM_ASM_001087 /TAXON_ID=426623 /ORGANISM="Chaetoceros affinis, Strain CCMP159" /LENGTH=365 /DNA_ID=CAMNT_0050492623 /DNA_START=165 /DNA_END=1262 /DNA_ORIENTATION=-